MSDLVKQLSFYIIEPDGIDSVETNIPQGLIRKSIMEINRLKAMPKYHHPNCNWWKWDWCYSWDKTDCNCNDVAEPLK